jgi:hypothetical protein
MIRKILLFSFILAIVFVGRSNATPNPIIENPSEIGGPQFTITPNPVNGSYFSVNITFTEADYPDATVVISDVLGKQVFIHSLKKTDFLEGKVRINVMDAGLDKGVYFVQMKSGDITRTLKLAIR